MTADEWLPWIPFILTLITAILGNIPDLLAYFRSKNELKVKREADQTDDTREAMTAVTAAGALITKQYQELIPTMRGRITELEDTLALVKDRLTQAEAELKAVKTEYEEALATIERLQAELEAAEAGEAATQVRLHQAEQKGEDADKYRLGYYVLRGQLLALGVTPKHTVEGYNEDQV